MKPLRICIAVDDNFGADIRRIIDSITPATEDIIIVDESSQADLILVGSQQQLKIVYDRNKFFGLIAPETANIQLEPNVRYIPSAHPIMGLLEFIKEILTA